MIDERAASNLIGFLLIFTLVASVIAIVSVTGVDALNDVKRGEQVNNAERAFDVLADNLNDVHREGAPSRATEINLQDARIQTTENATINVSAKGDDAGEANFTVRQEITPVVWQSRQGRPTKVAYEYGAVFRDQQDGGVIVKRPPIQWKQDRMIVPVVDTDAVNATVRSGRTVRVRGIRGSPGIAYTGDVEYDELWFNVTSQRAALWGEYVESETDTSCTIRDGPGSLDRATCLIDRDSTDADSVEEIHVAVYPVAVSIE